MPRTARKVDDKAKVPVAVPQPMVAPPPAVMPAPAVPVAAHVPLPTRPVVDTDSFLRVRDSAVGRLTTIMELLRSFTADYVRQTNLLMGEPTAEPSQGDLLSSFENAAAQLIMPVPEMAVPVEEKKERKKRTHDPNAPKRPLTPYFLYMQHARSIIANDLGVDSPKGAVQEEGQRRWAHMAPHEKRGWNAAYQYNLRLYNARVHSYKAGNPLAKNMDDEEALKYANEFQVPMPEKDSGPAETPNNDQDALAEQIQQLQDHQHALPVESTDTKTPKKSGGSRKRKTATPAPEPAPPEPAKGTPASPDKKRRRASAKGTDEKEEPKKSGRKKAKGSS
ncbi:hypothetical protein XA68_14315 [Ophiocordyceps unilateralis]|uniref:HMG box domain-containing protein n=1 Tax=Ophiocordyceps unilateralis TaxID=268505 RepID=A0A2A9PAG3_OPHUN|nr:hypothetical protein XA68_14315 [Ophiocordyceps unilateralis]